ncbi:hypothetical protein [Petrotoga sp. 9PWA.NaAc.5.4]|uniref:hypothetical protein n=1 Tax=Petrotoga sp. 9PWA.NaAc.5.4 TaxID=1434328 RepID=UPI003516904E
MIYFLRTNPQFAQAIGFDLINNFVPSEATFSVFKKKFDTSFLFEIIAQSIQKGIDEDIFDPNNLCIDSYPISFRSFFNNKKSIILVLSTLTLALNLFLTLNLFTINTVIKSNLFLISTLKLIRFLFLMLLFLL